MLTVKKLNNLLIYWILFMTNDDRTDNGTMVCHHSYIKEKFDVFFTEKPKYDFIDSLWKNPGMWNRTTEYIVKWNLETNEFINNEVFPEYLFTLNYVHNKQGVNLINDKLPKMLIDNYKMFFSNYDAISEEDLSSTLHALTRMEYEKIVDKLKYQYRAIFIKNLIK